MLYSIIFIALTFFGENNPEKILFNSNRSGNSEIYLYQDGEIENLSNSEANEWAAIWITADSIEFLRELDETIIRMGMNIYTKKAYDIGQLKVCTLDDKNQSVFGSKSLIPCKGKVYYQAEPKGDIQLLNEEEEDGWYYLNWTGDGHGFCYTKKGKIYYYDLQKRSSERLVGSLLYEERGSFSPDGRYFAFSSNDGEKKDLDLFLLDLENGLVTPLYEGPGNDLITEWSSDSETIYVGAEEDGNWDIYQVTLDGEIEKIIESKGFDGDPKVYYPR